MYNHWLDRLDTDLWNPWKHTSLPTQSFTITTQGTDIPLKQEIVPMKEDEIKNVIFNGPATVVIWKDGAKTVVKCGDMDIFDPEKGLAMAICKHAFGDDGTFKKIFRKWVPEEDAGELAGTPIGNLSHLIKQIFSPVQDENEEK